MLKWGDFGRVSSPRVAVPCEELGEALNRGGQNQTSTVAMHSTRPTIESCKVAEHIAVLALHAGDGVLLGNVSEGPRMIDLGRDDPHRQLLSQHPHPSGARMRDQMQMDTH